MCAPQCFAYSRARKGWAKTGGANSVSVRKAVVAVLLQSLAVKQAKKSGCQLQLMECNVWVCTPISQAALTIAKTESKHTFDWNDAPNPCNWPLLSCLQACHQQPVWLARLDILAGNVCGIRVWLVGQHNMEVCSSSTFSTACNKAQVTSGSTKGGVQLMITHMQVVLLSPLQ